MLLVKIEKGGANLKTLYLDFDNTIVESNKRIIEILNKRYNLSKTEEDLKDYGYSSIYPISKEEKIKMFESDEFYNGLNFKSGVLEVLDKYKNIYNIVIISNGTDNNLSKKEIWIKNNLPFDCKFIKAGKNLLNKNKVNMKNSIQIDDNLKCLETNASLKILYKSFNEFPWQKFYNNQECIVVNTWKEIDDILNFYKDYNCETLEKE